LPESLASATPTVGTSQTSNSDGTGTVHTSTDANGYVTTYNYTNGDLTSITPPSPQQGETLSYDALSRVSGITDGNGNQASYTYTKLDRVATTSYKNSSGGDTSSLTYTYDDDGNVLSVADSTAGTTAFTYDTLNRQTKKTLPDTTTITYSYDATNNLTSLTDTGGTVTYGYDNLNTMTSLTQPNGAGTETLTFGYDVNGRRTSTSYPASTAGTTTYTTYDKGGRITDLTTYNPSFTQTDTSYSYSNPSGPSGNYTSLRYSITETLNNSAVGTTNYSYDHLNRLTGAATTSGNAYPMASSYSYDASGNRLAGSTTGTGASMSYNYTYQYDTANQLKQVNSSTCTNDGNGNQTGCGTSYKEVYNARNQTTSASSPNGNLTHQYVGADSTERVSTGGYHATTYTYNALGLGTEKGSAGNIIAYTRDNKGNLVSERTASGDYYFLFDGLGSVVGLMDDNDNLVNSYVYDPYGVTEHQTGTQYNPWQFASGYLDASTLYYKYGSWYYDRFGRWTQQDSQPSANPYLYANDGPVNEVDPSGTISDVPGCITVLTTTVRIFIGILTKTFQTFRLFYAFAAFVSVFDPPLGAVIALLDVVISLVVVIGQASVAYVAIRAGCR